MDSGLCHTFLLNYRNDGHGCSYSWRKPRLSVCVCVNKKRPLLYAAIKERFVCLKVSLLFLLFLACLGYWEPLPRPPALRQPCLLPAAFPGKRGRGGGGQRRIPRKPRFPQAPFLWLCSGSFPARRGGERPPPAGPPGEHLGGRAANIWSGRGASPGGRSWRVRPPALPGPAARPPEEGEGRRRRGCEGGRGTGKGSPAPRSPGCGKGRGEGSTGGGGAGRGDVGCCRVKGQLLHVCLHSVHGGHF